MPKRAELRQVNGPFRPRTSGKAFSSGQKTLSITTSPVIEARKPTLPWIAGAERFLKDFSRMKPPISPPASFAQTMNTSAIGELEIHILAPGRLMPPGTFFARFCIDLRSDTWFYSVMYKEQN